MPQQELNLLKFATAAVAQLRTGSPQVALILEKHPQELFYFARDLLSNRFGRFFFSSVSASSSRGRKRQISALVPRNSRVSCWNFRNSSTSRSAFWIATGVGNASEIVLPSTLKVSRKLGP